MKTKGGSAHTQPGFGGGRRKKMRLLLNTRDLDLVEGCDEAEMISVIERNFDEEVVFFTRISGEILTRGSVDPESLKMEAQGWNARILGDLFGLLEKTARYGLTLDSQETNQLSLAARAADNDFNPWGAYGILADNGSGYPCFSVVLTEEDLLDIQDSPEDWSLVQVVVR